MNLWVLMRFPLIIKIKISQNICVAKYTKVWSINTKIMEKQNPYDFKIEIKRDKNKRQLQRDKWVSVKASVETILANYFLLFLHVFNLWGGGGDTVVESASHVEGRQCTGVVIVIPREKFCLSVRRRGFLKQKWYNILLHTCNV